MRGFVRQRAGLLAALVLIACIAGGRPAIAETGLTGKRWAGCEPKYEAVCARTSLGTLSTYANRCFAEADGAAVIAQQGCEALACPTAPSPVCARRAGVNRVYGNRCLAEQEGAVVIARGACPDGCAEESRAVCAVDERGGRAEYRSACIAVLSGARVLHAGKCVGGRRCAAEGVRVCALDVRTGRPVTYANLCAAESANAELLHRGRCDARWRKLWKRLRRGAEAGR